MTTMMTKTKLKKMTMKTNDDHDEDDDDEDGRVDSTSQVCLKVHNHNIVATSHTALAQCFSHPCASIVNLPTTLTMYVFPFKIYNRLPLLQSDGHMHCFIPVRNSLLE
jgi:hypothetical protein